MSNPAAVAFELAAARARVRDLRAALASAPEESRADLRLALRAARRSVRNLETLRGLALAFVANLSR